MRKLLISTTVACSLLAAAWLHTCAAPQQKLPITPETDAVFTSTRQVTSITAAAGEVWVGTLGGVLYRNPEGRWRKFTRLEGLPSQEVRLMALGDDNHPQAVLPRAKVQWVDGKWQAMKGITAAPNTAPQVSTMWNDCPVVAKWDTLRVRRDGKWRDIKLPPSRGTHVSALLPHGSALWAAMFGDGLWEYNGGKWKLLNVGLPSRAREITALTEDATTKSLWIGTRRDGVWEYKGGVWTQSLQPDEPYDHNGQVLQMFKGELFLSTLEDGLSVRTKHGWQQLSDVTLSSNAPRQMVEFQGSLYVRHGGGKVDSYDGMTWRRNVFPWLPRGKAMALATDGQRLYVAQWGGWSEWDGKTWSHFLRLPELQGLPLMSLLPDGETLWIGTQSRGIVEATRTSEAITLPPSEDQPKKAIRSIAPALPMVVYKIRWHDERHGLPDDWVTCLAKYDGTIYAGTFVGGLAYRDGEQWQHFKELEGENVTALEPDGEGGLFIATRNGVWHKPAAGNLRRINNSVAFLDTEAQALCKVPQGLWIATRTGLYFVTNESLQPKVAVVAQRDDQG